jgi:alpha-tubulin suppressor-like RCC1 family protein
MRVTADGGMSCNAGLTCQNNICLGCIVAVVGGDAHSCALRGSDNSVWCWGKNGAGQLGNASTADALAPMQVVNAAGAPLVGVTQLVAGSAHTCALRNNGELNCWGDNGDGQVGASGVTQVSKATPVGLGMVLAVAAGSHHTCAVAGNTLVYCWGRNDAGQLGTAPSASRSTPLPALDMNMVGVKAKLVGAGATHSCAIKDDGTLWCWGSNGAGELGNGSSATTSLAVQAASLGGTVAAVTAGAAFTCARQNDSSVFCWGKNDVGQCAQPPTPSVPVPTKPMLDPVASLAAGAQHVCARLATHSTVCWGRNQRGQLASGDFNDRAAPGAALDGNGQPLADGGGVGAGLAHSCAVLAGGVSCWGADDSGQLGDAKMSDENHAVPVQGLTCP